MRLDASSEYLGDSVYAHSDGHCLFITTENGLPDDPSNIIYLEPEVFSALVRYGKSFYGLQQS